VSAIKSSREYAPFGFLAAALRKEIPRYKRAEATSEPAMKANNQMMN
jgi:hypothetical protein